MPTININKFDASKVNVSEDMGKLNNGLKTMFVDYGGDKVPVRVQTPSMKMPFEPDEQDNDRRSMCLNCNTDREKIDGAQLSRGDDIRAIVELRYIWLNNGKFGATWVALQIQQRSNSFAEIEFVDSDDDEQ